MSACQDTWRRKETRRKNKTKQNNPCPRRGKEHTELPDRGHTRSEDILRPTLQGQEAGVLLLCSRETATCPETPTHWPLVSFFFFLSFSFSYPSHQFSMLKKKFFTKKKSKIDEASPRPSLSTWGPFSHRPWQQRPAWYHKGTVHSRFPWTAPLQSGGRGGTKCRQHPLKRERKHSLPFLKHSHLR